MTEDHAKQVLVTMVTAWPQRELSKPERDMWMRDLAPKDFASAMEAVDACRGAYDWLPTFHQFKQAYEGVCRAKDDFLALPPPRVAIGDEADAQRARDHVAGKGRPRDTLASRAYSAVWFAHLKPAKDMIGRMPA